MTSDSRSMKMTTIKFSPFHAEQIMQRQMAPQVEATVAHAAAAAAARTQSHHIDDTESRVQLSIDVPGVRAKDLVVEVDDGVLKVSGERKIGVGNKRTLFERCFRMDQNTIDTTRVTANLSAGVLVVTVPKKDKPSRQVVAVTEEPHECEGTPNSDDEAIKPTACS
eukprot:CAMPEP_0116822202 /NCGR_PEP_ID=MMETSP0418-20121206/138_1 /TAXON_ID=1158023 /ORGANISM="Astrosyne radiata, Strain 13vi08-1A" /LENGTH=165 /DNA_ID=CAMNT_0004450291 /DNA_START=1972 /DNA_END=2469 /DNA_ORIENTATION=+